MVISFAHSFHTADILYIPFNTDNPKLSDKKLRSIVILNGDVPSSS